MASIRDMLSEEPARKSEDGAGKQAQKQEAHRQADRSVDSTHTEAVQSTSMAEEDKQQRKRTKVSRACDVCRKKKTRCDAVYSAAESKVTRPCSGCVKAGETCSFQRVPLKRGPTKGYTHEGGTGAGASSTAQSRSRSNSSNQLPPPVITLPPINLTGLNSLGNLPVMYQAQQAHSRRPSNARSVRTNNSSTTSLNSFNPATPDLANDVSRSSSTTPNEPPKAQPGAAEASGEQPQPQAQAQAAQAQAPAQSQVPSGLFWKVPYSGPFDRRSSIDSVSSSITSYSAGNNSLTPPQNPSFSFPAQPRSYESSIISDSDDEYRNLSPRASVNSSSNINNNAGSPAMSVSSLSSLNQNIQRGLSLNPQQQQQQQQQPVHHQPISTGLSLNQLIDYFYNYVQPNFPLLPLNKQSLSNLLNITPPAPQAVDIHELNQLILNYFQISLDLVILITSKSYVFSSEEYLLRIYEDLFRISKKVSMNLSKYSQNIIIIKMTSLMILTYLVVLLGVNNEIIISSTISIFNDLKVFKLFWDPEHHLISVDNYDDYSFISKRLFVQLDILDSVHSLSFGLPKMFNIELSIDIVDSLFPCFPSYQALQSYQSSNEVSIKNNLKFGLVLSKFANLRNFLSPNSKNYLGLITQLRAHENSLIVLAHNESNNSHNDMIIHNFLQLLYLKNDLYEFLNQVSHQPADQQEDVDENQQNLLKLIKNHLVVQEVFISNVSNKSNLSDDAGDNTHLISPFLPIMFRQFIKSLNLIKVLINSLQFNKTLGFQLSKLLNEFIKINNKLAIIKPFKFKTSLNNHLNFQFSSKYLTFFENNFESESDGSSGNTTKAVVTRNWLLLMSDIKLFLDMDDYEGWY